jgi:hypothetical protein
MIFLLFVGKKHKKPNYFCVFVKNDKINFGNVETRRTIAVTKIKTLILKHKSRKDITVG